MPQWHSDQDKRRITGGKRKAYRTRRRFESGRYIAETQVGNREVRVLVAKGRNPKLRLLSEAYANTTIPDEKRTQKMEILRVVRSQVSADYNRRRIVTKGTVIATKLGEAVVTSRPGQDGIVNALLIKTGT